MGAIWGLMGRAERWEAEQMGARLAHRGAHEEIWSPVAHVHFGQRDNRASAAHAMQWPVAVAGELRGSAGAEESAAEVIWNRYRAQGSNAFGSLKGQFAVALYDAASDSVVLAVDRWSVQPLYFTRAQDRWAFASEYRALLALADVQAHVDLQTADFLQRTKYLPTGRGLLTGVHAVAPGQVVRLHGDSYEAKRYSPLTMELDDEQSEQQLAHNLREALLDAAASAIAGCDRIGIALSAGLDSTVTLGAVRAVAPDIPIHTYSVSFDVDDPDLALAAQTAVHFGTLHRAIILVPDDLPRLLPELVWAMEDPCAREEMLVYHVLAQEAAPEVPLLLYGHLADVLFGGMPRHLLIKLAATLPFARTSLSSFYDYTQTGLLPTSLPARMLIAAYYRGRCVPPPRVIGAAGDCAEDLLLHLCEEEPLNNVLLQALEHPTEVAAMERLHARAGVRFSSLFHDERVARCAFRIPDRLKIRGRQRKYILRRAALGIVPERFASRPKGMIRITQNARLWRVLDAMAAELLAPASVKARGLFDPNDVARLLERPRSQRARQEQFYRLWTLLLTELWCRTFIDARGAQYPALANPYSWAESPAATAPSGRRRRGPRLTASHG